MSAIKKYEFAVIATDIAIFGIIDGKLQVLMIQMVKPPFSGKWALPGGLIKIRETADKAAKRILMENTGVQDVYLEQLYTFSGVNRDPFGRVVSVAYFALISNPNTLKLKAGTQYSGIGWKPVDRLPILAYDHKEIVALAVERLRSKLTYTNIIYSLLPKEFTLTELQSLYELILDRRLDKRNFRKKMLSLGLIKKTGHRQSGVANRPADLFTFISRLPKVVEIL